MTRVFCDWCKRELTGIGVFGAYGRRVGIQSMNVCFKFEFTTDSTPEHLCVPCAVAKIQEAVNKLSGEAEGVNVE